MQQENTLFCDENIRRTTAGALPGDSPQTDAAHRDIAQWVGRMMLTLGMPVGVSGYRYLLLSILLAADAPDYLRHMTRLLYPAVAARCGTTACAVERAIRHAIEVCWQRGRIEEFNAAVGYRIVSQQERPGNRELIALFANCVRSHRFD